jgi:hypothetical protein
MWLKTDFIQFNPLFMHGSVSQMGQAYARNAGMHDAART